jgi:hypothetical protein
LEKIELPKNLRLKILENFYILKKKIIIEKEISVFELIGGKEVVKVIIP